MSRFGEPQTFSKDGQNLTVKTRPGLDLAAAAAAPGVLADAIKTLRKAINITDTKGWALYPCIMANRYFMIDAGKGPSQKQAEKIKTVLSRTLTGLTGDLTLKIGTVVDDDDGPSTRGYVSRWRGSTATKPHQNVAKAMQPVRFPWQKPKEWVRGAIHITDSTMIGEDAVRVLIHEATHKYAGTMDYSYFTGDGATPRSEFTNQEKAMANADSYAHFVVKVARYS